MERRTFLKALGAAALSAPLVASLSQGALAKRGSDDPKAGSKKEVPKDRFAEQLRALHEKDPEARVVLKADRGVRYAEVRGVFKTLQDIGFPGISLQVVDLKKGQE